MLEDLKLTQRFDVIGASGLEMASVTEYLLAKGFSRIVLHDIARDFGESFESAHRFVDAQRKARRRQALARLPLPGPEEYLRGIPDDSLVFLPQSWPLVPQNALLRGRKFRTASYPDLLLELAKGYTAAITGTAGKSSTAHLAAHLCQGRFVGNDRQADCDLLSLEKNPSLPMIMEYSNRHLALPHAVDKKFHLGVLLNIFPNHEREYASHRDYVDAKFSLSRRCLRFAFHSSLAAQYLSHPAPDFTFGKLPGDRIKIEDGQLLIDGRRLDFVTGQIPSLNSDSVLAAVSIATDAQIPETLIQERLKTYCPGLRFRRERSIIGSRVFINDAASCLPAASREAVQQLDDPFVLIFGGTRQDPDQDDLAPLLETLRQKPCMTYLLGPLARRYSKEFAQAGLGHELCRSLKEAFQKAVSGKNKTILYSPGGGSFDYPDKYQRGLAFDVLLREWKSGHEA